MGAVTRRVATRLRRGVLIGQACEHAGIKIVGAAHAMSDRPGLRRAGLRGVRAHIRRIIAVRGGVPQRVNRLIRFSSVIPVGMAGDKAVGGIEPAADGGLVTADAIRRRYMLRGDGRSWNG